MSNKRALLMTIAPLAVILALGLGIRLFAHDDEADDNARRNAAIRRGLMGVRHPLPQDHSNTNPAYSGAPATPADARTQKALENIVRGQVDAIVKRDYAAALTFAAEQSQQNYTVDGFKSMIETNFRAMQDAKGVAPLPAMIYGDRATMDVILKGGENDTIRYRYNLNREENGWRVSTVSFHMLTPVVKERAKRE